MSEQSTVIPAFLLGQLNQAYDEESIKSIVDGYTAATSRPVTLRANALKTGADDVSSALDAAGLEHRRVDWYDDAFVLEGANERDVWGLDIYRAGGIYLQSLSSMLPPLLLSPRAGADILDMCAAPGGKTSQISALTQGAGRITACELNAPRAERLEYNLEKLGVRNIQVMRTDARRLDEFFSFDQILLDAPCTGTGTVRAGDPRVEKRITQRLLDKVTRSQRALLDRGLGILKPGGTLVYSTCSILPVENERIVLGALKRHRDCTVAPVDDAWSERLPLLPNGLEGTLTVRPTELFEGFYVAVIKKA